MKITNCFKIHNFALVISLSAHLSFLSPAIASPLTSWIIGPNGSGLVQLGTLGGQGTSAAAINATGQVVGSSSTSNGVPHAFITGPNGVGMTDMGVVPGYQDDYAYDSRGLGLNAAGQAVGYSLMSVCGLCDDQDRAFITGPNGTGLTRHVDGKATSINDAGQVAGYFEWRAGIGDMYPIRTQAFITGPKGEGVTRLETLNSFSTAFGINAAGQVVGDSYSIDNPSPLTYIFGPSQAYVTGPNGVGMTNLGTLGGQESFAYGINDTGQVVGTSQTVSGDRHAFISEGASMTDLGTLGGHESIAYGINETGQVVGTSQTASGDWHAFTTGTGGVGMIDLNSFSNLPGGLVLTEAHGINNLEQIIAVGIIPEPATYALMLVGLGLVGFVARRKKLENN